MEKAFRELQIIDTNPKVQPITTITPDIKSPADEKTIHQVQDGVKKIQGPNHFGLIPDGNRRWGRQNSVEENNCHTFGMESALPMLEELFATTTTRVYTVWGMSTENFERPPGEVKALFRVIKRFMLKFLTIAHKHQCSFKRFGCLDKLPQDILRVLTNAEKETEKYTKIRLYLGINYGGRWDITEAVNKFIGENPGKLITEWDISKYISLAKENEYPEPDLIIRTGATDDCKRTSGYLSWQSVYTEFYFIEKLFPDVTYTDILKGYEAFNKVARRFGK